MEKHRNSFDDFLKEALKGHQLVPREKAKKAFLEEASADIPDPQGLEVLALPGIMPLSL